MTIAGEVSARFIETAYGLEWPAPFFVYQSAGIAALLEADARLLADEMGLGKTVQAVAALRILIGRRALDNCLIVCPLSVVTQWRRELRIWAPDISTSTVIGVRRRRRKVLHELPPKFVSTVRLDLTTQQRASYRRAEEEGIVWLRSLGAELKINHVLELILRLQQTCNFCPSWGESAKLVDLRVRLDALSESGEKALVFSQFVAEPFGARRLAGELTAFRPLLLTGSLSKGARTEVIHEFAASTARRLLIVSLRTGGLGLNLTAASAVFHFDRWWNPALETQAEDRAHQIGQDRPVQVFTYLCNNTVEERIDDILTENRALFANIIDGVATPALDRLNFDILLRAAVPNFHR